VAFLGTLAYTVLQIPGKIFVTNMIARSPMFANFCKSVPVHESVAFAKEYKADPAAAIAKKYGGAKAANQR
jgi:hypothetical protein